MNLKLLVATGLLGLAGSVGAFAPASATLIDVIYKGVVSNGSSPDDIGLFGPAGADLIGDAFVATFNMDTSKGANISTATENYIHGGTAYGIESPIIKATLEINGKSAAIDGGVNGSVQAFLGQSGVPNQQSHEVADADGNSLLLYVTDANLESVGNIPFTIDVPLDFTFGSLNIGGDFGTFHSGGLATSLDLRLLGFVGLSAFGYRRTRSFAPAELI